MNQKLEEYQKTRDADTMLGLCWPSVKDDGPTSTLDQRLVLAGMQAVGVYGREII